MPAKEAKGESSVSFTGKVDQNSAIVTKTTKLVNDIRTKYLLYNEPQPIDADEIGVSEYNRRGGAPSEGKLCFSGVRMGGEWGVG